MKKLTLLLLVFFAISFVGRSTDHHRWPIKTKPAKKTEPRSVDINDIIELSDPPGVTMNDTRYETKLIPAFSNAHGLKEGDLIKVKGYLQLVAYEENDDEYHIQISATKTSETNCLIVEVPDPKNVEDENLKDRYAKIRTFLRDKTLKGKAPGTNGNLIGGRAYIYVTGQLFFDAAHTHNQIRGKRGLSSHSLWEVHPIIDMNFAPKPM